MPVQASMRLEADDAMRIAGDGEQNGSGDEPRVRGPEASPGGRASGHAASATSPESMDGTGEGDVPEDVSPLMDRLAPSIQALVESDRLSAENKRALAQALTQFEARLRRSSPPAASVESVDAKQRYEKLETAINEFHASLKQIFRIGDESASGVTSDANPGDAPSASATERLQPGDASRSASEGGKPTKESLNERQRLLFRIRAAYTQVASGERSTEQRSAIQPSSGAKERNEGSYARFVSMYTALYPTPDRVSLLNEEG
ncbi:MAG: hypothetical protein GVY35_15660 [Bacteroidetes bacterium]|nr:hypothetical protein [Bacteroidota bacterium]